VPGLVGLQVKEFAGIAARENAVNGCPAACPRRGG